LSRLLWKLWTLRQQVIMSRFQSHERS